MKSKLLPFLISLLTMVSCLSSAEKSTTQNQSDTETYKLDFAAIKSKASEALKFVKTKSMNEEYCILIDMKIHSGRNRFFVWDFKKDTITHSYLVGHGCCDSPWGKDYTKENPSFSNVENSHCSSLGKYKIGERGASSWGVKTKYLLHGLEKTNSNALKRVIVFHSWEAVSDVETYPQGTPEGWGCPTLSNDNFRIIDHKLKSSKRPVLMWIYND